MNNFYSYRSRAFIFVNLYCALITGIAQNVLCLMWYYYKYPSILL